MPIISREIRWREFMCVAGASALFTLSTIFLSTTAFAAPPSAEQKSLDDALLEDLDSGLPKPPASKSPAAERPAKTDQPPSEDDTPPAEMPKKTLDDELLEGLEGEDVSLGKNPADENPLVRLNQRMKQVERRIADAHSDEKTQRLQKDISDDLAKLVAQLEQQCQQCKNPSSSASSQRQQKTSQSKPSMKPGDQPADKPADKPARESTDNLKERETAKIDTTRLQEMLKDVWGHLPPHLRQQMEQSANEEFLPKYESEISQYYRSLVGGRKGKK